MQQLKILLLSVMPVRSTSQGCSRFRFQLATQLRKLSPEMRLFSQSRNGLMARAVARDQCTGMAESGRAKAGSMSLGSVVLICAVIVNLYWAFCNWRIRTNDRNQHLQFLSDAAELKQEAQNCLNRARKIVAMAGIEHDFAVCSECH